MEVLFQSDGVEPPWTVTVSKYLSVTAQFSVTTQI
jgi:hypothetical protein